MPVRPYFKADPGSRIYYLGMLAGREAEQQIDRLLQRAVDGSSAVLVLRGDPGIGKTALLDYAASRAGRMRVLRMTGIEAESELALVGLYSLLHPVADFLKALPEPFPVSRCCDSSAGFTSAG